MAGAKAEVAHPPPPELSLWPSDVAAYAVMSPRHNIKQQDDHHPRQHQEQHHHIDHADHQLLARSWQQQEEQKLPPAGEDDKKAMKQEHDSGAHSAQWWNSPPQQQQLPSYPPLPPPGYALPGCAPPPYGYSPHHGYPPVGMPHPYLYYPPSLPPHLVAYPPPSGHAYMSPAGGAYPQHVPHAYPHYMMTPPAQGGRSAGFHSPPGGPAPPPRPVTPSAARPYSSPAGVGSKRPARGSEGGELIKRPRFGGSASAAAIEINKRITSSQSPEEVLGVVAVEVDQFDSVCMATALHKMAQLNCRELHYVRLAQTPDFLRLLARIRDSLGTFTARNLANSVWALAKMMVQPADELLAAMVVQGLKQMHSFNPQNIANTLWAFANLGFKPADEFLEGMARMAEGKLAQFTSQNISNTLLAFAKLEHHPGSLMDAIAATSKPRLREFTPQALSNTVWAFSRLDEKNERFLDAIALEVAAQLPAFNAQNLANTVWAYANCGYDPGPTMMAAVEQVCAERVDSFSSQNISNTLWGFAKLARLCPRLLQTAAVHVVHNVQQYQPQSIANTVWAFATLHSAARSAEGASTAAPVWAPDARFMEGWLEPLLEWAVATLAEFSPQNISNTVWGLATLKYQHVAFLKAVAGALTGRLADGGSAGAAEFSRQHLANTAWSFATLEADPGGRMLRLLAAAMVRRAPDCNPQEISNTVWAFAKFGPGRYNEELMSGLAEEAKGRIQEFSQQNLANLAWAYGKTAHYDADLLAAIARQATAMELALQHMTNILWSHANFGWVDAGMLAAFLAELTQRAASKQFNAQQLSNLLWSLTLLNECTAEVWEVVMRQYTCLEADGTEELPEEALTQVYQSHLLMRVDKPGVAVHTPPALLRRAHSAWLASVQRVRISDFQKDVARLLGNMGLEYKEEHKTEDGLFSIDLALTDGGAKIAIEVDGPHHFTSNTHQVLGDMAARDRLLAARGWQVVSIPFWDWDRDDAARTAYLTQALERARGQQARARAPPGHANSS